jgi:hypothetical protein
MKGNREMNPELTREEFLRRAAEAKARALARRKLEEDRRKAKAQAKTEKIVTFPRQFSEMEIARRQAILDQQIDAGRWAEEEHQRMLREIDPYNLGHWNSR